LTSYAETTEERLMDESPSSCAAFHHNKLSAMEIVCLGLMQMQMQTPESRIFAIVTDAQDFQVPRQLRPS